jgi:hypothetical protein
MAKYFIDFNNYTDISDVLSEWTPRWSSLSTHWAMEVIDGKKCLKNLPGSPTTPGAFSYNLLDGFTGDIELVYKIRANGYNFDGFMETALCGSGSTGSENGIIGYYHAGTGKHQIGEYSNGSNMASSQYSIFGYDNNLWYWVRLRIENNQTFYRTWPDGSQEPSAWDITWTPLDTSIISTALWHGIGTRNAADGSRYCACIGFGINGDTAPITPLDKVLIRFNNYANATEMLSEWTPKWGSTVSDWSLQNVNGEKCLAVQNASSNECFLAYNAINGVNQIEIAYKFMAPVNTSHCINPYLKASEVAKQDAYGVYYDYGTHHKFLYYDGGLVEEGYLYPMVYTPGNWYWTRIKIAGSNPNFYFKTWADGTAEPETWYDSQTYPAIPDCAYNGLGTLNGVNLSYCSVVGFGVNGASAPINEDPVYVDISVNVTGSFSISGYISNSSDNSNGKFKLLPNRNRFNRNTFSENNNISNIINSAFFGIPIIQLSSNISLTTNVNADATVTHSGGNIVNITGGISSNTSINNATLKNLRLITCSISNTTTTNNANILNSRNIGVNIANTTNVNSPILQNITNISCNISSNTTVDGSVKNTNSIGATISTISNLSGILGNVTNKINVNISSSTSISGNVLGSRNISLTIPSTTTVDANIKNVFSRTSIINCNSTVDANISKALNITCGINASSSINANAIIARVISIDGGISSTTVINNVNSIKNSNIISTIPLNCNVNANLNEIVKISSNIDSSSNVAANNKFIRFITSSVTNPSTIDINSKVFGICSSVILQQIKSAFKLEYFSE